LSQWNPLHILTIYYDPFSILFPSMPRSHPSNFPTKITHAFVISPIRVTRSAHLLWFNNPNNFNKGRDGQGM
jgi:hypothetical protein